MVPLAIVTAVVILVGWFPAKALLAPADSDWTPRRRRFKQCRTSERLLKLESKTIDSKAAAIELAREQYQLVAPGQSLIQVLPENSAGEFGDPGRPRISASRRTERSGSAHRGATSREARRPRGLRVAPRAHP